MNMSYGEMDDEQIDRNGTLLLQSRLLPFESGTNDRGDFQEHCNGLDNWNVTALVFVVSFF
jgi:hypothetical protein